MIYINNFSISDDGTEILVYAETDEGYILDSLNFWTDATFKNESDAIDLTSLLSQTSNKEVFSITAEDVGLTTFFDGIFFIEFTTTAPDNGDDCNNCNNPLGVATKLVSAYLCLLEHVLALDVCKIGCSNTGCSCTSSCQVTNIYQHINALSIALKLGTYTEAIYLLNQIRKLCTTCSECLDLDGFSANQGLGYYTSNNILVLQ